MSLALALGPLMQQGGSVDACAALLAEAFWYIDADQHDGNTSVENLGTAGATLDGTEVGTIKFFSHSGDRYFWFPGGTGTNTISAPDQSSLDVDDFDIRIRVSQDDWTPASLVIWFSKFSNGSATDRSYFVGLNTAGTLRVGIRTAAGTTAIYASTAATGFTDGTTHWVRVTRDSSTGNLDFYTAADSSTEPTSWTTLGATVSGASGALTNSTVALTVGAFAGGNGGSGFNIYRAILRDDGASGAIVADMNASLAPETGSWVDGAFGNTWTVNRPTTGATISLVDRSLWQLDGVDDYIQVPDDDALDIDAGEARTLMVVTRSYSPAAATQIILGKRDGANNGWNMYVPTSTTPVTGAWDTGTVETPTKAATAGDRRMAVLGVDYDLADSDQGTVWIRGEAGTPLAITDASVANAVPMRLGATSGTASNFYSGEVVAAALWSRELTSSEWSTLELCLSNRAGRAANATDVLSIPTYEASNEPIHPSVVKFGGAGWNGYTHWMAMTPYPNNDETVEDPSIVASNDGLTWVEPGAISNPITANPGGTDYNADTELVYDSVNDVLVCYYSQTSGSVTTKTHYAKTSSDGETWSSASTLYSETMASQNSVSETVVKTGASEWSMWTVNIVPSPNTLVRRTSTTATGTFGSASTCTVNGIPDGYDLWHIYIFEDNTGTLRGLFQMSDLDVDGSGASLLMLASSSDGDTWTISNEALITEGAAGEWDENLVYRGCIVQNGDTARCWYSGRTDPSPFVWGIGYIEFPMSAFPTV